MKVNNPFFHSHFLQICHRDYFLSYQITIEQKIGIFALTLFWTFDKTKEEVGVRFTQGEKKQIVGKTYWWKYGIKKSNASTNCFPDQTKVLDFCNGWKQTDVPNVNLFPTFSSIVNLKTSCLVGFQLSVWLLDISLSCIFLTLEDKF